MGSNGMNPAASKSVSPAEREDDGLAGGAQLRKHARGDLRGEASGRRGGGVAAGDAADDHRVRVAVPQRPDSGEDAALVRTRGVVGEAAQAPGASSSSPAVDAASARRWSYATKAVSWAWIDSALAR
jgi:hypothetical protein